MSKFFVILVEDLGDEDSKFFRDPDRFLANTKIDLPTDCDVRGCTEISKEEASRFLREKGRTVIRRQAKWHLTEWHSAH
jgi:hypothetical protein